jgi:hypothetical protein
MNRQQRRKLLATKAEKANPELTQEEAAEQVLRKADQAKIDGAKKLWDSLQKYLQDNGLAFQYLETVARPSGQVVGVQAAFVRIQA